MISSREKKDTTLVGSASVFQTLNSTVNMNLSTIFKLKGINFTVSAACASGSHAIGVAYMFIKTGLQECIITGGAQEINYFPWVLLMPFRLFPSMKHEPEKASRPFDT